jgi:hypothetical protein
MEHGDLRTAEQFADSRVEISDAIDPKNLLNLPSALLTRPQTYAVQLEKLPRYLDVSPSIH